MKTGELTVFERIKSRPYYENNDGKRLSGVTTILMSYSEYMKIRNLISWAYDCGDKGIDADMFSTISAEIGTVAHLLIAEELQGLTADLSEYSPRVVQVANQCVKSFRAWRYVTGFEPILIEERLHSEAYQFGGTLDLYGVIGDKKVLVDLKTSTDIFKEYLLQVSAYKYLAIENGYDVDYCKILRIPKDNNSNYDEKNVFESDMFFEMFLKIKEVYEIDKVLTKEMKSSSTMLEEIKTRSEGVAK